MTTYDTSVKFPKLNFDDFVQYQNRKVQLTHYDTDHKTPLFLQFVDDVAQPVYCLGFQNFLESIGMVILATLYTSLLLLSMIDRAYTKR